MQKENLNEKFALFIGDLNDVRINLAKFKGE